MRLPIRKIGADADGAAALEFAIAFPVLISMIWGMLQVGLIFLANAGMQHALGEAARMATIFPTPSDAAIGDMITAKRFGTGNGTWDEPEIDTNTAAGTKTISVTYHQPLEFIFFTGPTVDITKSKVVYLAD